jgi:hypothetical protein
MRCTNCHGGTVMLPVEPGKTFGYLVLCPSCGGTGTSHRGPFRPASGGRGGQDRSNAEKVYPRLSA